LQKRPMPEIIILCFEEALASSISLPAEMFKAAEHRSRAAKRKAPPLQLRLASPEGGKVQTMGGLVLDTDLRFEEIGRPELLLIPALWRHPTAVIDTHISRLRPLLRRLQRGKTILCAVSTGSYLLAEAGLLKGRPATTHWYYLEDFRRRYPGALLQERHLMTRADNLYCAGSVNSVADLSVHFIGLLLGAAIARYVERHFSPEIRRPFESHAYLQGGGGAHGDEEIARIQDYMQRHCDQALPLLRVATEFGMSTRNLGRRFRTATGISPATYLRRQRLVLAQELLRTSNLPVREVALRCGYSNPAHFSALFRQHSGESPGEYRRRVRGKLFTPQAGRRLTG